MGHRFVITSLMISILMSFNVYSQNMTIHKTNADLEDILREIHRQTGYSYTVSTQTLQNAKRIDIHAKDISLEKVLVMALKDQPFIFSIRDSIIIIKERNSFDVKGRILNDKGEPVTAFAQVKGKTTRVLTDSEGNFLIENIQTNSILLISGIRFNTLEVNVNGRSILPNIIVQQNSDEIKNEVEIERSRYERNKPNEIFSIISKDKLAEQFDLNILQRLTMPQGCQLLKREKPENKEPIAPWGSPATINGSTFPLIVLDDMPFEGDLETINPKSIESITILKDTAATSIYGVGGANGVIVITTKKGKSNKRNKKVTIIEDPVHKNPEAIR
jgi:TonB-dependent SusC/RagA subfamily outer membrane receptor